MSKCILVVEDQEDNRQILRDLLGSAGYQLVEAENGEEALKAVARQRPDLILMDIQLPILDGYETTRRIRSNEDLKSIPIMPSRPMLWLVTTPRPWLRDATAMLPSRTVPDSCWQKSGSIWPDTAIGASTP